MPLQQIWFLHSEDIFVLFWNLGNGSEWFDYEHGKFVEQLDSYD